MRDDESRTSTEHYETLTSDGDFDTNVHQDEEGEEVHSLLGHDLLELACVLAFFNGVDMFTSCGQTRYVDGQLGINLCELMLHAHCLGL